MAGNKVFTGIVLPHSTMERLDTMASQDRRDRSAEIAVLVDEAWDRRQAQGQTPTQPISSISSPQEG